jgi:hypothetical protein
VAEPGKIWALRLEMKGYKEGEDYIAAEKPGGLTISFFPQKPASNLPSKIWMSYDNAPIK